MNLRVEQRPLAQSDQDQVVVLGPSRTGTPPEATESSGNYKILGARPGLTVSLFDIEAGSDFVGNFATQPCVAIDVLFEATGQGWVLGPDGERAGCTPYRPGRLYLMAAQRQAEGFYDVPEGSRFRGVDIRVDLDLWKRMGAAPLLATLDDTHPLHGASTDGLWVGVLPLAPQIAATARALYDCGMKGVDDLALEARCLDIVNAAIAVLREPRPAALVPARDRRPLQRVHDLIMADLPRSWTLAELARLSGISEKRLKSGFKEIYGLPVYAFVQEARLSKARHLLKESTMSVTEVGLAIGYSSVSHFSALFSRRYGIKPSQIMAAKGNSPVTS